MKKSSNKGVSDTPARPRATPRRSSATAARGKSEDRAKATPSTKNHLSTYFQEVGQHDVLTPDEEVAIAQDLERKEIRLWKEVFGYPPVVDFVGEYLVPVVEGRIRGLPSLRRAAAATRSKRTKAARDAFHKSAAKVARSMRNLDRDGDHVEALLFELRRLQRSGLSRVGQGSGSFSPTCTGFARYLNAVQRAERAATAVRNRFVEANLRLVVTVARRYNHGQMPLPDLIQEGNIGLMKAVRRFDHERGFRFSTYASWWIRHAIGRAVADKGRAVRVPVHMIDTLHRLSKAEAELSATLGRHPTTEELSEAAQVPADKIEKLQLFVLGQPISLDRRIGDEEDRTLAEVFQDPTTDEPSAQEVIDDKALTAAVRKVVNDLTPMEADIVRRRFGLDYSDESTLAELGERYHLSRERIRQIQNQALGKLRRSLERRQLA